MIDKIRKNEESSWSWLHTALIIPCSRPCFSMWFLFDNSHIRPQDQSAVSPPGHLLCASLIPLCLSRPSLQTRWLQSVGNLASTGFWERGRRTLRAPPTGNIDSAGRANGNAAFAADLGERFSDSVSFFRFCLSASAEMWSGEKLVHGFESFFVFFSSFVFGSCSYPV